MKYKAKLEHEEVNKLKEIEKKKAILEKESRGLELLQKKQEIVIPIAITIKKDPDLQNKTSKKTAIPK